MLTLRKLPNLLFQMAVAFPNVLIGMVQHIILSTVYPVIAIYHMMLAMMGAIQMYTLIEITMHTWTITVVSKEANHTFS